jgi:hypothetical protein
MDDYPFLEDVLRTFYLMRNIQNRTDTFNG